MSRRWQRQGSASAHIIAVRDCEARVESCWNCACEFVGKHVVGKGGKRGHAPAGVLQGLAAISAPAPKNGEMDVFQAGFAEAYGKCIAAELRIATRAGEPPHVGNDFDLLGREQSNKVGQVAIRMADRPKNV